MSVPQSITIPCSEGGDQLRIFTFGLTSASSDSLQGAFDCVQQLATGYSPEAPRGSVVLFALSGTRGFMACCLCCLPAPRRSCRVSG